jgi:hypothetical protein
VRGASSSSPAIRYGDQIQTIRARVLLSRVEVQAPLASSLRAGSCLSGQRGAGHQEVGTTFNVPALRTGTSVLSCTRTHTL